MPIIKRPDGQLIHFDITGHKNTKPIITTHGFIENGSYWTRTGISAMLADKGYIVVDMDMRGFGRSFPNGNTNFKVDAVAEDIGAVADYMGFDKFHLLTHATGGMVGTKYVITHPDRILSFIASDTASSTFFYDPQLASEEWDDKEFPEVESLGEMQAKVIESFGSYPAMMKGLIEDPDNHPLGPFYAGVRNNPDPQRCYEWSEDLFDTGQLKYGVAFALDFGFNDADRHVKELRELPFPVLAMAGELDYALLPFTEAIARCAKDGRFHVFPGQGHMTAIEYPEDTFNVIYDFLKEIEE